MQVIARGCGRKVGIDETDVSAICGCGFSGVRAVSLVEVREITSSSEYGDESRVDYPRCS